MLLLKPEEIRTGVFKTAKASGAGLNTKIFGANTAIKDVISPKNGVVVVSDR